MTKKKLACVWRTGCNQIDVCEDVGCCQAIPTPTPSAVASKNVKLLQALQFCLVIADEEYPHQLNNLGAESALRHIARKCREALADFHGESP